MVVYILYLVCIVRIHVGVHYRAWVSEYLVQSYQIHKKVTSVVSIERNKELTTEKDTSTIKYRVRDKNISVSIRVH